MTSPAVVEIANLRVRYGRREALKDVTLEARRNEILGVIGPAQSGKTTLLKTINRTIDDVPGAVVTGTVKVDGQDVRQVKDVFALRRKIGMVAPLPVGLPLSIFDNVAFAPRMAGIRDRRELDERVERCLRQAALWDEVKDKPARPATELSGGQQQRLCIARALAVEPEVLLMDEPCSALDPVATLKIEDLMRELAREYTIVIVTHNMQQAARVSDYTAVMMMAEDRAGEMIEFGPTREVFTYPKDKRTEDYITGRFG